MDPYKNLHGQNERGNKQVRPCYGTTLSVWNRKKVSDCIIRIVWYI